METMSCTESHDFLKLFGCLVDIGTDVVGGSLETNILQKYNGSLQRYLEDKDNKHRFHHQMDDKKLKCCLCPPAGCSIPRKHKMEHWIFESVYNIDPDQSKKDHVKRSRNGFAREICLSQYIAKDVSSESLDLTILLYFLVESEVLLQNERDSVMYIHDMRNRLCHPKKKTYQFTNEELNDMWIKLEEAIVCLVFPKQFKKTVKGQIQALRNSKLGEHDVSRLSGKLRELSSFIIGDTEGEGAAGNNLLSALSAVVTEDRRDMKKQVKGDLLGVLEFMHEAFKITMKMMEYCSRVPQNGCKMVNENQKSTAILYSEELTGRYNEVKESLLSNKNDKNGDAIFTAESVERGCVQIELSAHPSIFDNEDSLYRAIQSLIEKIIDAANLGSDANHVIDITWVFKGPLNEAQRGSIMKLIRKAGTRDEAMVLSAGIKCYDSEIFLSTTASQTDNAIEFCSNCLMKDAKIEIMKSELRTQTLRIDEYLGYLSIDNPAYYTDLSGSMTGFGPYEDLRQSVKQTSSMGEFYSHVDVQQGKNQTKDVDNFSTEDRAYSAKSRGSLDEFYSYKDVRQSINQTRKEEIGSPEVIDEDNYKKLSKLGYLVTVLFTNMMREIIKPPNMRSEKAMYSWLSTTFARTQREFKMIETGIRSFDFELSYRVFKDMPFFFHSDNSLYSSVHDWPDRSSTVEEMRLIRNDFFHMSNVNINDARFTRALHFGKRIAKRVDKQIPPNNFEKQVVALEALNIAFVNDKPDVKEMSVGQG